tara:strand:+ start:485 stop:757 length:273 start_codon:yes stop_codon:yes gene_type:complete
MAHKKAGGSTALGRDSNAQRLGVKLYGGQPAAAGAIIVRQRGTRYHPGEGVRRASDDTLYAAVSGTVEFTKRKLKSFTGALRQVTFVNVK